MSADDLATLLDELGKRLGPTGSHVFELAVRQVVIDAVLGLVSSAALLIATAIIVAWAARLTRRMYADAKAKEGNSYRSVDAMDYAFPWIFGSIAIAVVIGMAGITVIASASALLNPEYAAIRDILRSIR